MKLHEPINGEFIIDGLTPGNYAVAMQPDESSDYHSDQTTFEIKESDVNGIEIKAQLGSSISGIVALDGETSPAILAQLRNLLITCNVANNSVSSPRSKINPDGTFRSRAIPSGKARLNVSSYDGKQDFILLRTEKDGVVLPPDGLEVTNNSQINGIKLIVAHGSGSIRGHVNVIGGTVPSGVVMYVAAKQVLTVPANARNSGGQTDPNWRFIIENLIPGDYEITMNLANLPSLPASSPLRAKMVKNVTVKKSSESAIVFTLDLSETGEKQ